MITPVKLAAAVIGMVFIGMFCRECTLLEQNRTEVKPLLTDGLEYKIEAVVHTGSYETMLENAYQNIRKAHQLVVQGEIQ